MIERFISAAGCTVRKLEDRGHAKMAAVLGLVVVGSVLSVMLSKFLAIEAVDRMFRVE